MAEQPHLIRSCNPVSRIVIAFFNHASCGLKSPHFLQFGIDMKEPVAGHVFTTCSFRSSAMMGKTDSTKTRFAAFSIGFHGCSFYAIFQGNGIVIVFHA
jgi:hypothetical protein